MALTGGQKIGIAAVVVFLLLGIMYMKKEAIEEVIEEGEEEEGEEEEQEYCGNQPDIFEWIVPSPTYEESDFSSERINCLVDDVIPGYDQFSCVSGVVTPSPCVAPEVQVVVPDPMYCASQPDIFEWTDPSPAIDETDFSSERINCLVDDVIPGYDQFSCVSGVVTPSPCVVPEVSDPTYCTSQPDIFEWTDPSPAIDETDFSSERINCLVADVSPGYEQFSCVSGVVTPSPCV